MKILILFLFIASTQASILEKGCKSGIANDCFEYAYKKSIEGDQLAPLIYFEKGCDLKDGKSCYALEKVFKKLNQNKNRTKLLQKSCEYNFAVGCFDLGSLAYNEKRFLRAIENFERGCQLGLKKSCEQRLKYDTYFSKIIRSSQEELNTEEKEHQKIYLELLRKRMAIQNKNCTNKKFKSCTKLAKNYLFLANIKEARKWGETACNNKQPYGCLALGEVEQKEGKLDFPSFEKACDLDLGIGCLRYAQSIEKKNLARAMNFFRRSCQAKLIPNAESCFKYSKYHSSNPKLAIKFQKLACKLDKMYCDL